MSLFSSLYVALSAPLNTLIYKSSFADKGCWLIIVLILLLILFLITANGKSLRLTIINLRGLSPFIFLLKSLIELANLRPYADRTFRPFFLRVESIALPAFVDILARKPCRLFRFKLLG